MHHAGSYSLDCEGEGDSEGRRLGRMAMIGDEGQEMRDKRWNRLERGLEGDCSLLCRRDASLQEKRGGSFNY